MKFQESKYWLDTETKGSTQFRNPRAPGCSILSAARALLGGPRVYIISSIFIEVNITITSDGKLWTRRAVGLGLQSKPSEQNISRQPNYNSPVF